MTKRPRITGRGADIYLGSDSKASANSVRTAPEASEAPKKIAQVKLDEAPRPDSGLSFCGFDQMKQAAARQIENDEKLANQVIELQEKSVEWAKDTPFAPLFEAQAASARKLVAGSAATARNLWRIPREA